MAWRRIQFLESDDEEPVFELDLEDVALVAAALFAVIEVAAEGSSDTVNYGQIVDSISIN